MTYSSDRTRCPELVRSTRLNGAFDGCASGSGHPSNPVGKLAQEHRRSCRCRDGNRLDAAIHTTACDLHLHGRPGSGFPRDLKVDLSRREIEERRVYAVNRYGNARNRHRKGGYSGNHVLCVRQIEAVKSREAAIAPRYEAEFTTRPGVITGVLDETAVT